MKEQDVPVQAVSLERFGLFIIRKLCLCVVTVWGMFVLFCSRRQVPDTGDVKMSASP